MRVDRVADLDSPEVGELFRALWLELDALYGPNPGTEFVASELSGSECDVFVIYDGADAVGCVALRAWIRPSALELKRMYVRPDARGSGAASMLLEAAEKSAANRSVYELRLETGTKQPRAIAFYVRNGFAPCDCWGHYVDDPESRCFVKRLQRTDGCSG